MESQPRNEFSVVQFFKDGRWDYVRRCVSADEAMKTAQLYTTNVASQLGITQRVIITDGGDFCCFEWQHGKGITFPPRDRDGRFYDPDRMPPERKPEIDR